MSEQRSDEWFKQRLGRFTASEISDLLGEKGLGLTGEDYAFRCACESVFGRDESEDFESFDMRRGNELEPLAFEKFKELKGLDFIEVKQATFFPYSEHAGASPDGLVGNDECLEIKCPRPKKFFKYLIDGKIDKKYYYQMQMQMLCTNSKRCHFFNYIIFNGKEMHHTIIVERDEKAIELIKTRLEEAIKIKSKFVETLKQKQL
jgi:putative phage-type endonuclease